jgi:hypothetical protein
LELIQVASLFFLIYKREPLLLSLVEKLGNGKNSARA